VATELPFTISLDTLGGVATPLIRKGAHLPAEASEVFSTAADNQKSVEVSLYLGERASASENVPIGRFHLRGIPPAPRGIPQIKIKAIVDPFLILTVTAEDQVSGIKEVLDAVDLTRIHVPPEALKDGAEAPKTQESTRDSRTSFADYFSQLFGTSGKKSDTEADLTLSESEAASGGERTIKLPDGKQFRVKIPASIKDGQRLRLRGLGTRVAGGQPGDLFLLIRVRSE
jgi:molecular chaperone DnaK